MINEHNRTYADLKQENDLKEDILPQFRDFVYILTGFKRGSPVLHLAGEVILQTKTDPSCVSMSTDYLQEEHFVYRVFGVIQEEPQKQDQYGELLANYYCHTPESFVAQFSNCIYTVLTAKGSSRDIGKLIQFIAVSTSRCMGNERVPMLAPLIIEV